MSDRDLTRVYSSWIDAYDSARMGSWSRGVKFRVWRDELGRWRATPVAGWRL